MSVITNGNAGAGCYQERNLNKIHDDTNKILLHINYYYKDRQDADEVKKGITEVNEEIREGLQKCHFPHVSAEGAH